MLILPALVLAFVISLLVGWGRGRIGVLLVLGTALLVGLWVYGRSQFAGDDPWTRAENEALVDAWGSMSLVGWGLGIVAGAGARRSFAALWRAARLCAR